MEMSQDEIIRSFRSLFPAVSQTDEESARFVSESDVERMLALLAQSGYLDLGKVCYVLGTGKQPQSVYNEMEGDPGIRVVNYENVLPRGLLFLPSYRGLIRIDDPSKLYYVFENVVSQSRALVYIFAASLEASFLAALKRVDEDRDYSFGVKKDSGYLIYLVDEDRDDSPTGAVEFSSHSRSGPWKNKLRTQLE